LSKIIAFLRRCTADFPEQACRACIQAAASVMLFF